MDYFSLRIRLLILAMFMLYYVSLVLCGIYNQISVWPNTLLILIMASGLMGGFVIGLIVAIVAVFLHASSVVYVISFGDIKSFSYYEMIWVFIYPIMGLLTGYTKHLIGKAQRRVDDAIADIEVLAQVDEATKFYNRRRLYLDLRDELNRAIRYSTQFTLIFIRPLHFKEMGMMYGEEMLDATLAKVADVIRANSRETDRKARYSDDILAVIAPDGAEKLGILITRLKRQMIPIEYIKDGEEHSFDIQLRIGEATYPEDGENIDELVATAESHLEGYAPEANDKE